MDASDSIRIIKCRYAELSGANPDRVILRTAQNEGMGGLKDHLGLADYNIKPYDSLVAIGFSGSSTAETREEKWQREAAAAAADAEFVANTLLGNETNVDASLACLTCGEAGHVSRHCPTLPSRARHLEMCLVDALAYDDTWREAEMTGPPGNKVRPQP